jgi:hypothetical protein
LTRDILEARERDQSLASTRDNFERASIGALVIATTPGLDRFELPRR